MPNNFLKQTKQREQPKIKQIKGRWVKREQESRLLKYVYSLHLRKK